MPKFVIEREIPDAGAMTPDQLHAVSQTSCGVLREMGPQIPVAAQLRHGRQDLLRLYCPDEETVRTHAQKGGFPANRVSQVRTIIDPTTSE